MLFLFFLGHFFVMHLFSFLGLLFEMHLLFFFSLLFRGCLLRLGALLDLGCVTLCMLRRFSWDILVLGIDWFFDGNLLGLAVDHFMLFNVLTFLLWSWKTGLGLLIRRGTAPRRFVLFDPGLGLRSLLRHAVVVLLVPFAFVVAWIDAGDVACLLAGGWDWPGVADDVLVSLHGVLLLLFHLLRRGRLLLFAPCPPAHECVPRLELSNELLQLLPALRHQRPGLLVGVLLVHAKVGLPVRVPPVGVAESGKREKDYCKSNHFVGLM